MLQQAPPDEGPLRALAASMLACAGVLLGERALLGAGVPPLAVSVSLAGLGAGVGLLFAAATGVWLRLGRRLGGPRAYEGLHGWMLGLVPGAAFAAWLVLELQAWPKLHGKHAGLAAGALVAALALCGLVAAVMRLRGRAASARRWPALIALAASALLWVDAHVMVATYPGMHAGVRLLGLWLYSMAACLLWRGHAHAARAGIALGVLLLAVSVLRLDSWDAELAEIAEGKIAWTVVEGLRAAADVDGDGHASILGGLDCAPLDPSVHPAAREIAGNGIDDNCRLGDAPPLDGQPVRAASSSTPSRRANYVVLVTIDALRPDRMSAYGYARPTTPNVARFFSAATRYDNAFTAGGSTSLALPALLRGRYPRRLELSQVAQTNRLRLYPRLDGAPRLEQGEYVLGDYLVARDDAHATLAQQLSAAGLRTLAAVDDGQSQLLEPGMGTDGGFDVYRTSSSSDYWSCEDAQTTDLALSALRGHPQGQPYFLWLHLYGPHLPSVWHDDTPRYGKTQPDRYDHEITFTDRQIGRVLDALRARGEVEQTLVVLSADHGENFWGNWERNHATNLHAAAIRVPLMIRGPGFTAHTETHPVSIVDVAPTILSAVGVELPASLDGVSLLGWRGARDRPLLVETVGFAPDGAARFDYVGVLDEEHLFWLELVQQRSWFGRHDDYGQPPREQAQGRRRNALRDVLVHELEHGPGLLGVPPSAVVR